MSASIESPESVCLEMVEMRPIIATYPRIIEAKEAEKRDWEFSKDFMFKPRP